MKKSPPPAPIHRVADDRRRTANLSIWLTETEKAEVDTAAQASLDTSSQWARRLILTAARDRGGQ